MSIETALLLIIAALAIGTGAGIAIGWARMAARNAAHAECVECPHHTAKSDVRTAQGAARAHRAETGHMAIVVVN
jgi:hypothetical protein